MSVALNFLNYTHRGGPIFLSFPGIVLVLYMSYSVFPFLAYGKPMTFFWFGERIFFRYDGTNICQAQGPNKVECPISCLPSTSPSVLALPEGSLWVSDDSVV